MLLIYVSGGYIDKFIIFLSILLPYRRDKLNALLKCRFTFIDAYWLLIDQYLKKNQNVKNNQKGLFLLNREF